MAPGAFCFWGVGRGPTLWNTHWAGPHVSGAQVHGNAHTRRSLQPGMFHYVQGQSHEGRGTGQRLLCLKDRQTSQRSSPPELGVTVEWEDSLIFLTPERQWHKLSGLDWTQCFPLSACRPAFWPFCLRGIGEGDMSPPLKTHAAAWSPQLPGVSLYTWQPPDALPASFPWLSPSPAQSFHSAHTLISPLPSRLYGSPGFKFTDWLIFSYLTLRIRKEESHLGLRPAHQFKTRHIPS